MRNPVLFVMSLLAGVNAALALGTLQDLISPAALGWIVLASAAVQAGVQFWVRGQVTPLVAPRDASGRRLIPQSAAHQDQQGSE